MLLLVELLVVLVKILYYQIEAVIICLIPQERKRISGKIALVTGAGSGIGKLIAIKLADNNASVILWDINKKSVTDVAVEIQKRGGKAWPYKCDVSKREDVYSIANQIESDVGVVDILVNNAGIFQGSKTFLETSDPLIQRTMEVNTLAHFWTIKAFLPGMIKQQHGHILSVASIAGLTPCTYMSDYCSSKHAAVGLYEVLALELNAQRHEYIKTTLLCPAFVNTGLFNGCDPGRFPWFLDWLTADEVADAAVTGIMRNETRIILPRAMKYAYMLMSLMPYKSTFLLSEFLGLTKSLESYDKAK